MGYVDGSFPCPLEYKTLEENGVASEIEHEYMSWVQNDCAVMSILAATLSNDALSFVIGRKSSKEIWCRLKEKYVDDSWYNIAKLKTSLDNIQKGSDSIDMYLLRVKSFCDQLAVMGVDMADEDIIEPVLHGLSYEFAVIKSLIRIKTLNSFVSMKELRSLLLIAEDEIDQTMKSRPLSLETVVAAFGDTSRGTSVISNTNALTDYSSKPVSQVGTVPHPTVWSTIPGVASPIGCTMHYLPNTECMMSATHAALNGCIIYPSPAPCMSNVQPLNGCYSSFNTVLDQS